MSDLLTTREVADTLGLSTETVLRWWRQGKLPGIQLPGGKKRFRADAFNAWLDARDTGHNEVEPGATNAELDSKSAAPDHGPE